MPICSTRTHAVVSATPTRAWTIVVSQISWELASGLEVALIVSYLNQATGLYLRVGGGVFTSVEPYTLNIHILAL